MNWSSVKNLLIAILVAANLFLLFNIARQDRTRGYLAESEIRDAAELLYERGYSVSADIIPTKKFKAPVYESHYSDEYYTEVATALASSEREMLYTLPNGGISISTKSGALIEFDNEFDFRYSALDNPDSAAYTEITASTFAAASNSGTALSGARLKSLSAAATEFLCKQQTKDSNLSAEIAGAFTDENGRTFLLVEQCLDGYEIYSHYAVCVFEDSELIFAHGRWYFSDTNKDYNTELCDQINILFTDMATLKATLASAASESVENSGDDTPSDASRSENITLPSVSAVNACYVVYWSSNKTALYFIPAWQIDHNDSLTIVYNATNATMYSSN